MKPLSPIGIYLFETFIYCPLLILMISHSRYKNKTRSGEIKLLLQGVSLPSTNLCSTEELLPAMQQCSSQLPSNEFIFIEPQDATGMANVRQRKDVPNFSSITIPENMPIDGYIFSFSPRPVLFNIYFCM
jgi:hypothetical protein